MPPGGPHSEVLVAMRGRAPLVPPVVAVDCERLLARATRERSSLGRPRSRDRAEIGRALRVHD
eukprot:6780219-Alexandrium_andersonii.AAC.1